MKVIFPSRNRWKPERLLTWNTAKVAMNHRQKHQASHFSAYYLLDRRHGLYVEDYFNERLYLERKRSERTKRPFVLMLIHIEDVERADRREKAVADIASLLLFATRETDLKGWYQCNEIIGVIFSDLDGMFRIRDRVCNRIHDHLYRILRSEDVKKIRVSFHIYPEGHRPEHGLVMPDPVLYPDLSRKRKARRAAFVIKRGMDIAGSVFVLALLFPLFFIPLLVGRCSHQPVLCGEERVGMFGTPFTLLCFHPLSLNRLRRDGIPETSWIDRLPQFFNVLKGEMSLVGPQACLPQEYRASTVWRRQGILEMKPGLTGLSQISERNPEPSDEAARLDFKYVREWSLWLDIKILLKTPLTFVGRFPVQWKILSYSLLTLQYLS